MLLCEPIIWLSLEAILEAQLAQVLIIGSLENHTERKVRGYESISENRR